MIQHIAVFIAGSLTVCGLSYGLLPPPATPQAISSFHSVGGGFTHMEVFDGTGGNGNEFFGRDGADGNVVVYW